MFKKDNNGEFIYLEVLAQIDKPAPRSGRTVSGYGKKLPCSYMVQTEKGGKFHRVYCAIYSNAGSNYIVKNGEKVLIK